MTILKRIGFACKYSELHPTQGVISIPEFNTGTTTVAWLNRQKREVAEQRLWDLMKRNIESAKKLVEKVGSLEPELRIVRLTSDFLPAYTHRDYSNFWQQADVVRYAEQEFAKVGEIARRDNVRLSFHPGQFCCIVSENPGIVQNSIEEFEYHVDMARWMGYGKTLLDFKINVHLSGKRGVEGFNEVYSRLSPEARNCITLENDEFQAGLDVVLKLKDKVGIVLDLHHHWIRTGEYIQPTDSRIPRIIDSWRGVRPVIHYSVSREEYLPDHPTDVLPDMATLLASGSKKQKLRAHSDGYTNQACNDWAISHRSWADIMTECKHKNLVSFELHKYATIKESKCLTN